ncbi:MAG TPA: FAD-binding protein, partial [Coxiellaceae bacterium]|nr:FAD-binding protein [Coxiellaceae bacterium]
GYLLNKDGERFMERYSPHLKDLECRDIVARSIMTEILEGRGCGPQQRYVLLKVDHVGEEVIRTRLPGIRELSIKFAGVDPVKDPIPVAPTCHYMMGGIPTTMHGQVLTHERGQEQIVEGLYAAGECACVSVHGANRLGTNSLLDLVVFGRAVGLDLEDKLARGLDYAHVKDDAIDAAMSRYRRWERDNNTEDMADIRHHLKKTMSEHFGVFREEKKMEEGLRILRVLAERLQKAKLIDRSTVFNMARFEALELDNLMEIGIATAVGALNRKESRGAHSRYDYTERDDKNWLKHSLYFKEGAVAYRPVNMKPRDMEPVLLAERE